MIVPTKQDFALMVNPRQQWEHLELHRIIAWEFYGDGLTRKWPRLIDALNELGQDGWRFAGMHGGRAAILIREK